MLILITGVPGSGKSLYAVKLIQDYIEQNKQLLNDGQEPRELYSDIDGLNIEGVQIAPDDWRDCPDGSIVFYDECQQKYGPDGSGRSGREDIQEFETHRHRGFDIVLITQHSKLLHAHIRRLVGRHYHVERQFGTQNAKIYQKDGQIDTDKPGQLKLADSYMWSYPKKLYGSYKSATLHTHKASMPKWLKRSFYGAAVIGLILVFLIPKSLGFFTGDAIAEQITGHSESTILSGNDVIITPANPASPVACITMGVKCSCYNAHGFKLDIPFQFCKSFTEETPRYLDFNPRRTRRAVAS